MANVDQKVVALKSAPLPPLGGGANAVGSKNGEVASAGGAGAALRGGGNNDPIHKTSKLIREAKLDRGALITKVLREVRIMQQLTHVSKMRRRAGPIFSPETKNVASSGDKGGDATLAQVSKSDMRINHSHASPPETPTSDNHTNAHSQSSPNRDAIVIDMQRKLSSVLDRIQLLSDSVVEKRSENEQLLENMEENLRLLESDGERSALILGSGNPNADGRRLEVWNPSRILPMSSIYARARKLNGVVQSESFQHEDEAQRLRAYRIFRNTMAKQEASEQTLSQVTEAGVSSIEKKKDTKTADLNDRKKTFTRQQRRSIILGQAFELSTSAPVVSFDHGSKTEIHQSHFCTYEKAEVIAAGGKYFCAECGSTSRALKLDADEHGVDLYCEPCWIIYYDETFDGVTHTGSRHVGR
eukprot:g2397.t1